ncbi:hypothetical protein EDD16DRAFT_467853 [Pisolithus croceorrhizus]|nr:hypothetical protein EDD16DRAFT_467853 [Pisolithus croceorrhizus]KAI6106958.1 hypothetical protein EV401DRAFT_470972 [Pisolithus croceorrhizus]KAI6158433.1 hypothetical protein EDD17DRAFT_1763765 [Pisolithus thermaeus]
MAVSIPTPTSPRPVPDVATTYTNLLQASSLLPNFSQVESLFSHWLFTGTYTPSPSSSIVDVPQPSTSSCSSSGGLPNQACASFNLVPTNPSTMLITPSASDISAAPLITATPSPVQSPSQSQVNTSFSQGSHTASVGETVGFILLGVFLAILVACLILRYRRHAFRRRVQDPLIDSVLPSKEVVLPLPGIIEGVESRVSSFPPPAKNFDSELPGSPSVSACTESPYSQLSSSHKSMYPKDFQATGIAL